MYTCENSPQSDKEERGGLWAVIHGAFVAALGGLLFGFDTAVVSGATDALKANFHLDSFWLGFTVAIALIGTVLGSLAIGKPADVFGRKSSLFLLAVLYFVSAIGCAVATNWTFLLVARFIGGLAIGAASVVAPMYIAEISPSQWRGRLVAVSQLNVVIGILLSYVSNYAVAQCFAPDVAWRWMLGIVAIPSLLFFFLIFRIMESPRWLVRQGRLDEARRVLLHLGEPDVERELLAIQLSLKGLASHGEDRLLQRRYGRPVFLALAIASFNQLSGINAVMYYAPKIFAMAGAAQDSALLQSIIIGITLLVFTIAAMFFIDRFGRRILIMIGSVGMIACLAVVAKEFAQGAGHSNGNIVLGGLIGYIAFFAFSQGAVIWVFISEIFPNTVRAKGQALGSFTHWFMAAAVSWTFPVVADISGVWAFGFFDLMMVLQFLFAWKIMPETKGGALEDIEQRLGNIGATPLSGPHQPSTARKQELPS
jgi:sugar porter (SP) family MFS transporter